MHSLPVIFSVTCSALDNKQSSLCNLYNVAWCQPPKSTTPRSPAARSLDPADPILPPRPCLYESTLDESERIPGNGSARTLSVAATGSRPAAFASCCRDSGRSSGCALASATGVSAWYGGYVCYLGVEPRLAVGALADSSSSSCSR